MIRFFKFACLWVAACSLASLAPAQNLQHRRKAFRSSTPAATYLINQNFEGTGYDNSETWTESGGTVNEDYTTNIIKGSQSLSVTGSYPTTYASYTGQTTVYAFCRFRMVAQPAQTNHIVFRITNAANTSLAAMAFNYSNPNTQVKLFANGAFGSASSVNIALNTNYYVWLKFVSGGTCELAISTTSTKPSSDGSGNVYLTGTGASDTAVRIYCNTGVTDGTFVYDNVLVDDAAIGNDPNP